jgi:hypothetical protein
VDVLDSGTTAARRPRRTASIALAGALVTLVVVVPDARQDGLDLLEPAGSRPSPGALSLELEPGPTVVGRTGAQAWNGLVVLHLDEGAALLQVSAAARAAAVGPAVRHSWGDLTAWIGDRHCLGSFGWRSTTGGPYGGGRVDLACDDGSRPTGELRTYERPPVEDTRWSGILDLAPA